MLDVRFISDTPEYDAKVLAEECNRYAEGARKHCPIGMLACPLGSWPCAEVNAEAWEKIIETKE